MTDQRDPITFVTDPARTADPRARKTTGSGGRGVARSSYSGLNDALAVYVAGSAVLTAVPVAMNRPTIWLIWVSMTAVVALLYFGIGYWRDRDRPLLSARHPWLFGLALVIPVYALLQSLPFLGGLVAGPPIPERLTPASISLVPDASQMAALRFAGYILFAMLAIEVASRIDRARRIGWWIFWGVVAHAVWALIALNLLGDITLWGGEKKSYQGSATGTFVNRNSFATFLSMGAVLGLALLFEKIDKPSARKARSRAMLSLESLDQVIVWAGLGLILITLISTQSRMGFFAGGIGALACVIGMRMKAGANLWRTLLAIAAIGAGLLVAGIALYGQDLIWRFLFSVGQSANRINGYQLVLELIGDRPLLGYGFDTFRPAFELVHAAPMPAEAIWDRAHSTYLSHWTELGLLIGSVPLVLAWLVARRLLDTVRRRERDYALGVAGLSILLLVGIHSLIDFSLEMPANVVLMLAILGLGLAHRRGARVSSEALQ